MDSKGACHEAFVHLHRWEEVSKVPLHDSMQGKADENEGLAFTGNENTKYSKRAACLRDNSLNEENFLLLSSLISLS